MNAIISAFTKNPVKNEVAMPGEITLRGPSTELGGHTECHLDTTHFSRDHFTDLIDCTLPEQPAELGRHSCGHFGVDLVVEETVQFDDPAADMSPLEANSLDQFLHCIPGYR